MKTWPKATQEAKQRGFALSEVDRNEYQKGDIDEEPRMKVAPVNKTEPGFLAGAGMALLLLLSAVSIHADQFQRKPLEDMRYEDHFTFQSGAGTYTVDPWVWAYTPEFAEKFRMPEKWIDKDLKGILAVAFRMTTIGNMNCGYGGKEDNCWPVLECQLDVYYDNRIKLPWTNDEIKQDFLMRGVSSRDFLHDLNQDKGYRKYKRGVFYLVLDGGGSIRVDEYGSGEASISYFDREYQPGIGVIGWVGLGVCPKPIGVGKMFFYDTKTREKMSRGEIAFKKIKDIKPMLAFEFSESFMRRANALYEVENKQNKEVAQRLIRQFFESRKATRN